jgi:hypothetical protein
MAVPAGVRHLVVMAGLPLAVFASAIGSCSKEIDNVDEAKKYVDEVIDGAPADSKAASGAPYEVTVLVGQADRIENIRKLFDEAPGVVCDGLSAADTTNDALGPSRAEIVDSIRSNPLYNPENDPYLEAFIDEVAPDDIVRRLTSLQMIELGDSLCDVAQQL